MEYNLDMEEIEVKFLGIDPVEIEKKLISLGAGKIYDRVFRDRVFDFPDWRLNDANSWLRLRDKGDKITLSLKKRLGVEKGQNDQGMEELETIVDNFEMTTKILEKLGMIQKFNQEKRRVHFIINNVDVDIDYYPLIPPHLEIEGKNWDEVRGVAERLGLNWNDRKKMSAMQVFEIYGVNEKDYGVINFDKQVKRDE